MASPVVLRNAAVNQIVNGGSGVIALYGPMLGGIITNPYDALGQGIEYAEELFVNLTTIPQPHDSDFSTDFSIDFAILSRGAAYGATFSIQPGGTFQVPAGFSGVVFVNAVTSGHKFSAVGIYAAPSAPVVTIGVFPPSGPTGLTNVLPSYLYQQYTDDDDLQAFVTAYNEQGQSYVDWFNNANLPIYTGLNGALLDWVAEGLYGIARSHLSEPGGALIGPYNTWRLNSIAFNGSYKTLPTNVTIVTDDIFKRIITWHFLKGDGKYINIRWLKRRIMRFLMGTNGINFNVDQTYQISVIISSDNVSIRLLSGYRTLVKSAMFNTRRLNDLPFNEVVTSFTPLNPLPNAAIFKEAVQDGALELPFQFNFTVSI